MPDAVITSIPAAGGGGGGGGDIVDELSSGASLDGVMSYEVQDAAPAATADYAKLYSKEVTPSSPPPGDPVALYNLDSDYVDDVRGAPGLGVITGTPSSGDQWVTLQGGLGAAFGDQLRIANSSYTSPTHYLTLPDPDVGTGAFTFEMFFDMTTDIDTRANWFSNCGHATSKDNSWGLHGDLYVSNGFKIATFSGSVETTIKFDRNITLDQGSMHHWAIVRSAPLGNGNSSWHVWVDGAHCPASSGYSNESPTVDYSNNPIRLGRFASNGSKVALFDSVKITKSALYSGTGSITPPTAPFGGSPPSPVTQLFAMDGTGTETQLT